MGVAQRKEWSARVLDALARKADLANDRFTFLAGLRYRQHLVPHIVNVDVPMEGLGIGRQLQFLSRARLAC